MMNKKFIILPILIILLTLPAFSFAEAFPRPSANSITLAGIPTIITNIVDLVWKIFAGLAIIMFIVAGFKFLTAQGNPNELQDARKFVIWGMVGVAVAIIGFSIVATVNNVLFFYA